MFEPDSVADLLEHYRTQRERLYHPPGGHTSSELDIVSEPAARALAITRLEAEAENARWEAERVELAELRRLKLIKAAEMENHRRDVVKRIKRHRIVQQTEPRLCRPPPKLRDIIRIVAEYYDITVVDIVSERRTANVVRPRQVFCYLARTITTRSFPDIGRLLGGRDWTTCIHAVKRITELMQINPKLAADVAAIRKILGGA